MRGLDTFQHLLLHSEHARISLGLTMPRLRAKSIPPVLPAELPLCKGPKLGQFKNHDSRIEWLERLDDRDNGDATQGYVFRARIKGSEYAIKVFKFYDPQNEAYFWGPVMKEETTLNEAAYCMDPFYAECRAYGRLQQPIVKKTPSNIAIPCHGFLFLQEKDKQHLLSEYDIDLEEDMVDEEYQKNTPGKYRARAIVKDLASDDHGVHQRSLIKIRSGIRWLKKNKIYNRDIGLDNYRDGQIVDFGSSFTEPHDFMDQASAGEVHGYKVGDLAKFDEMVTDEKIQNPNNVRATSNQEFLRQLRPRKR